MIIGVGTYISNSISIFEKLKTSYERINSITEFNYSVTPELSYFGNKMRVIFNGICLKQNKITYTLKK